MPSPPLPQVSIGLPVYNGGRYIKGALDSLLGQDYPNLEFIVSDNASTDETQEICQAYAAHEPRLTYHRSAENRGAVWNFNRVFELSRGEFFLWAAADDRREQSYVSRCADVLARNPAAVLCFSPTFAYAGGDRRPIIEDLDLDRPAPRDRVLALLKQKGQDWAPIVYGLIRASALRGVSPMLNHYGSDVRLIIELALRGPFLRCGETSFDYCSETRDRNVWAYYERVVKTLASGNLPRKHGNPTWIVGAGMLGAVSSAPLPPGVKALITADVLRLFFLDRRRVREAAYLAASRLGLKPHPRDWNSDPGNGRDGATIP